MTKSALTIVLGLLFLAPTSAAAQVKDLSWGTSAVGTSGHRALVTLAALLNREMVQSFWAFTLEVGLGILARDMKRFKQWRDLSGERIFTGPLPFDTRAATERAMGLVGLKHNYVEVDLAVAGSA